MSQPLGKMIIELGLDSANFTRGMKGANQQIKTSMTEMKAQLNVMGKCGSELDILKVKQTGLSGVLAGQNKKVAEAKEKYEAFRAEVQGNTQATQAQKDALIRAQNEYVKAIGELGAYENQLKEVSIRLTAMESSLYQNGEALVSFGEKAKKTGEAVSKVGQSMTVGITMPLIALGTYAVKATADFDAAMSQVSAVSGAVGEDLEKLREKAREMGEKTKFSAKEAADAMNYMAMAGWKTEDMLNGIEGIMSLAAASGESLATTSDIVTDALTGFGKSAADSGRLADIMAAASSNANTNVAMMGETFKYCTPIAGSLGFSMEDTAEAIGLMANSGIKASMAGTAMRGMMNNLTSDVEFTGEAFGKMVVQTVNADGSMRDLNSILSDCREAFSRMSESERVANAEALVGKNAMSGFLAVMNAAPADIEKLHTAIAESEGAAGAMAETMQDNLSGQLVILKSQTDELAISYGDILTPKLRDMVSGVQAAVGALNQMDAGTKEAIVNIGLFAATAGPAVLVVGKLVGGIGNLAGSIGSGMQSFALWAAKITHTTAVIDADTAAMATNSAGLLVKTARTVADTAASKLQAAAGKTKGVILAAENGLLYQQAAALNTSIIGKAKDTAATIASTAAEKTKALTLGISTSGLSIHTIATAAQTAASSACAVATGLLSAAIKLLLGPIGWAAAGITALVTGVVAAVKWFTKETEASKKLKEETEGLAEANDTLAESLDSSESMYESNTASIQAGAGAAGVLADQVAALSKVENKSAKQKKELQAYVKMLNSSMEGLNVQYDEQTDALNVTTDGIYSQIAALEKQAQVQAAQERMTEILKEQIRVKEQLELVQGKITEATENDSLKNRERKKILEELTGQEAELKGKLDDLGESYLYVTEVITNASEESASAVTENTSTILEAYGSIGKAYDDLGEQQKDAVNQITDTYETMAGKLSSLSEKIKLDNETTWAKIQENQADTIEKTREFSGLYAQLMEEGVSESYLKAIGATGPESIPLLKDMIAQGTDTILQSQEEWQKAYGVIGDTLLGTLDLDDEVQGALKEYVLGETGIYGTLKGAIEEADLNALGKSLTDGVGKGILEGTDGLKDTTEQMVEETTSAAEEGWGIHSPSRVFADIGENLMTGLVLGITNREGEVYKKAQAVADQVTRTIKGALQIHSPSRVMRDEVGKNIALGIAEGITQNKKYAKKSAEEIADAIVQAARKKLENEKVYRELNLADEAAYWDSVRKQVKDGTQAKIDADKQYFQAKKALNQKMTSLESDYATKAKKTYEDLNKNIQSLQDSYTDKMTSRMQSLMDSMGLFEEFSSTTELTTEDLLNNLNSQVTGLHDWTNDLRELERRGVSGDLLEELRELGHSAAGEVAVMTEMTEDQLDEYISLWKEKQRIARKEAKRELAPILKDTEEQIRQMREQAALELQQYKQEYMDAMQEIGIEIQKPLQQVQNTLLSIISQAVNLVAGKVSEESDKQSNISRFAELGKQVLTASAGLPKEFNTLGENTVDGMIQGLQEKSGALCNTMTMIIRQAIQAARDEAQIHSPSRVMRSIGMYMMKGLGAGIEDMQGELETVAGKSAAAVSGAFRVELDAAKLIPSRSAIPDMDLLTSGSGVVRSIKEAIHFLRSSDEQERKKQESGKDSSLLEQLIASNGQMVKLLQMIAEKNLIIDRASLSDAVDFEFEGGGRLKARGAV